MSTLKKNAGSLSLIVLVLVLGVVVTRTAIAGPQTTPREADRVAAARTEVPPGQHVDTILERPEGELVGGLGVVEPREPESRLSAAVPGRIARIGVTEGQRVEAGAVLVELESATEEAQLAAAEAQTKPVNGNKIGWVEADACQLPFEDNSFDRVLAVECIFHFPSRETFLAEAARVLKPGGYLAVSDFVPTLMFFGKTPIWMAIRPRIAKSYGTLGNVPLRSYKSMGKRAGLELAAKRNIRRNTLPTYPFLLKFFREQGSADAQKTMIVGTRWMKWLSKLGLIQYRVYTYHKPA